MVPHDADIKQCKGNSENDERGAAPSIISASEQIESFDVFSSGQKAKAVWTNRCGNQEVTLARMILDILTQELNILQ